MNRPRRKVYAPVKYMESDIETDSEVMQVKPIKCKYLFFEWNAVLRECMLYERDCPSYYYYYDYFVFDILLRGVQSCYVCYYFVKTDERVFIGSCFECYFCVQICNNLRILSMFMLYRVL